MPLDWGQLVSQLTNVQKLVHLAARRDPVDTDAVRTTLLREMRRVYEAELTDMAARIGCRGRRGRLSNGPILTELNEQAKQWAEGINNTYNYDLGSAIRTIATDAPRANRHVYAKRLGEWDSNRAAFKNPQIAQNSEGWARSKAQQDFRIHNPVTGTAELMPKAAVCPICQGIVARGEIPLQEALRGPSPPYHPNCCPPDVPVLMADDTERPISQIAEGESVASRWGSSVVVQVYRRQTAEDLYRLSVHDRVVEVTGDHPVLTNTGWRPARELRVGDMVALSRGREWPADDS